MNFRPRISSSLCTTFALPPYRVYWWAKWRRGSRGSLRRRTRHIFLAGDTYLAAQFPGCKALIPKSNFAFLHSSDLISNNPMWYLAWFFAHRPRRQDFSALWWTNQSSAFRCEAGWLGLSALFQRLIRLHHFEALFQWQGALFCIWGRARALWPFVAAKCNQALHKKRSISVSKNKNRSKSQISRLKRVGIWSRSKISIALTWRNGGYA